MSSSSLIERIADWFTRTRPGRLLIAIVFLAMYSWWWLTIHYETIHDPKPTPPVLSVVVATIGAAVLMATCVLLLLCVVWGVRWVIGD